MLVPISIRLRAEAWAAINADNLRRAITKLGTRGRKFSAAEVADLLRTRKVRDIGHYLDGLVEAGTLRKSSSADGTQYRTTRAVSKGEGATQAAQKRQHMWNILRGRQARPSIAIADLALLSSTDTLPVLIEEAADYAELLVIAGFLGRREDQSVHIRGDRNSGPLAPRVLEVRFVVDANTGTAAWSAHDAVEAAR